MISKSSLFSQYIRCSSHFIIQNPMRYLGSPNKLVMYYPSMKKMKLEQPLALAYML